jgi:hypothetical protein
MKFPVSPAVRGCAGGAMLAAALLITAAPAHAELKVMVTIKPIHALVAQVMEGVGTPALLVQGAASPHTYALKPSDAKALNHAESSSASPRRSSRSHARSYPRSPKRCASPRSPRRLASSN